MNLEIQKLSKKNVDDFLNFFDERAFCDNPDWADCYCRFFYFSDERKWEACTSEQNRAEAASEITCGRMNGYLAYENGRTVGWCNADDIMNYSRILADEDIPNKKGIKKAAVVCFVIDPDFRRRGVASGLLTAVCNDFAGTGYDYIEAYPRKHADSNAGNYHGHLRMFQSAGFEISGETNDFYIVGKKLQQAAI